MVTKRVNRFGKTAKPALSLATRRHAEALRSFVSTPCILFGCWICINLVMSRDPSASAQRFVLTASVFVVAATVLLLPATERELNRWLGIAVLCFWLGKMFLRIWLFGIYLASPESFFRDRADPVWFTFLVSVIGLHYVSWFRTG